MEINLPYVRSVVEPDDDGGDIENEHDYIPLPADPKVQLSTDQLNQLFPIERRLPFLQALIDRANKRSD